MSVRETSPSAAGRAAAGSPPWDATAAEAAGLPLRDRVAIWGGLAGITILAWLYLIRMPMAPGSTADMGMAMPMPHRWTLADAWLTFFMWAVMMTAMMVPSTGPMVLMYARIARSLKQAPASRVWLFGLGYLVVWTVFSAAATVCQAALQRAALISDTLRVVPLLGGTILVVAGLYQLTPLKEACLSRCRSPLAFFMAEWREGSLGAFVMGLRHGAFCVGCCWMLMGLLFAAGVMNLLWVAAISGFVLLEKATPRGKAIAIAAGIVLMASGLWMAAGKIHAFPLSF